MSTTQNELKPVIAALLAFITIYVIQTSDLLQSVGGGEKQEVVVIFIALLMIQILFEIIYKYEGKACEITEGIFTALSGVIGFYIAGYATERSGRDASILSGAIGAAIALWIWKRFLKMWILPTTCSPGGTMVCPPCAPVQLPPAPPTGPTGPVVSHAEKFGMFRRY